ncbi:MAG: ABC transporter ATP-binding protein [Anaerotignum sp.]|nr:ABC transporter ATP-binding protein [Anaerotignum sp.]
MSILIRNITKKYDNSTALNDVSLKIQDGAFIAILGPSGCGKTTLLRVIGGFVEPTTGSVQIGEEVCSSQTVHIPVEKRDLGMVFQSFALWPHMTVREHIEFPLDSRKNKLLSRREKKEAVDKSISCTGLEHLADRFPHELSGGQRQRVALARAIVSKPSLLLMDEPLSALDAELRVDMRKEIQDIHRLLGTTIIYVTHDQGEALAMADHVVIMKDGKIEQIGTPEEIYLYPNTEFVATFVSKCNMVKGIWNNDLFFVDNSEAVYSGEKIGRHFKERSLYPVRPEEFILSTDGKGMKGVVVNKQYSGREVHYSVKCGKDIFLVYDRMNVNSQINDEVVLIKEGK